MKDDDELSSLFDVPEVSYPFIVALSIRQV